MLRYRGSIHNVALICDRTAHLMSAAVGEFIDACGIARSANTAVPLVHPGHLDAGVGRPPSPPQDRFHGGRREKRPAVIRHVWIAAGWILTRVSRRPVRPQNGRFLLVRV